MYDVMDAETWTIVIGVVLGFFALPAAMFAIDLRRERRQRADIAAGRRPEAPSAARPRR